MRKIDIVANTAFLVAVAVCLTLAFVGCAPAGAEEAVTQPTTAATTEEITEPTQEPTETEPQETTPPVTLYDVPLDEELQLHIISEAESHGIDPAIIFAMAFKESTFRTDAIGDGGNSYGLLQIQPRWHYARMQKLGCSDLLDPFQNVTVAVDYLCENLNRYGSIEAALTAYNRGHYAGTVTGYARDVMAKADELRGDLA